MVSIFSAILLLASLNSVLGLITTTSLSSIQQPPPLRQWMTMTNSGVHKQFASPTLFASNNDEDDFDYDEYDFDAAFQTRLRQNTPQVRPPLMQQQTPAANQNNVQEEQDNSMFKSFRDLGISLVIIWLVALWAQNASTSFFARTPDAQYEAPDDTAVEKVAKNNIQQKVVEQVDLDSILKY